MREVAVRITRGSNALVNLIHVNTRPGHVLPGQRTKHNPGCVPATDSHKESTTGGDSQPSIASNRRGRRLGDGLTIIKNFDLHPAFSSRVAQSLPFKLCGSSLRKGRRVSKSRKLCATLAARSKTMSCQPAWAATRKSSWSVAVGLCQPPGGVTLRST